MKSTMLEPENIGCSTRSRKEPRVAIVKGSIRMHRPIAGLIVQRFRLVHHVLLLLVLRAVLAPLHAWRSSVETVGFRCTVVQQAMRLTAVDDPIFRTTAEVW